MNRKKIIIIVTVILLILTSVFIVKYQFDKNVSVFKKAIIEMEASSIADFELAKSKMQSELEAENPTVFQIYKTNFNQDKAIESRDTLCSFLYLSEKMTYKTANKSYLKCLKDKSFLDLANAATQRTLEAKELAFEKKYGEAYLKWHPKFASTKLVSKSTRQDNVFPSI